MTSHEDEISELIVYVTELRRTFNHKLDDHLYIMDEQNRQIEQQMRIIDEQKQVVDELAWQIRDLRASVRKVSEQKGSCVCNYENHEPRLRMTKTLDSKRKSRKFYVSGKTLNLLKKKNEILKTISCAILCYLFCHKHTQNIC